MIKLLYYNFVQNHYINPIQLLKVLNDYIINLLII